MKYFWKVWLWSNGKKSVDYTKYLQEPIFIEPHLDETLSTGEIVLECMPIETKAAFPPKTKIRLERYNKVDFSDIPKTYDFVVDSDKVEEYVGCSKICTHRIELIEPSVIAQGMHVDNIALTRELNDVNLNYKTTKPADKIPNVNIEIKHAAGMGYARPELEYGTTGRNGTGWYAFLRSATHRFTNSFRYDWSETDSLESLKSEYNGLNSFEIKFTIPKLICKHLNQMVYNNLFECPIRTKIVEQKLKNGKVVAGSQKIIVDQLYNPINIQNITNVNYEMYNNGGVAGLSKIVNENYQDTNVGSGSTQAKAVFFPLHRLGKYPAMINTTDITHNDRIIQFIPHQLTQSEVNENVSYLYNIICQIEPYENGAIILQYAKTSTLDYSDKKALYSVQETDFLKANASDINISTSFIVKDNMVDADPLPYLVKPTKYSCYNLIRKSLLTIDTQIIDNSKIGLEPIYDENYNDTGIQYPIVIDKDWMLKLKNTPLHETIFEMKNLWEVLLQIGYYLHAIPYLEFATDGTDRFVLKFKQLGKRNIEENNEDSNLKITIFNSTMLSEYFTQLDSYVSNMFSPQNEVDEWIVPKTSDSNYLVSNETAELQTSYNISEIIEFDIKLHDKTEPALDYIFEKTVYNVLSIREEVLPNKGAALYYELGTSTISGLNYVPPEKNNGDTLMSLKRICNIIFGVATASLKYNDLCFHIKYRTQDSIRISQFRPNLHDFAKNSSYEKYPHHEQYYGQQDKIVDSERFSANLWGRLVRTANNVYQCQEYAPIGKEKETGDLIKINNELYYVVSIENEYYANGIFQKVTYSKNFNQISQVVTIPSEPRFYEISERSTIRREVRLYDFIKLSVKHPKDDCGTPVFINSKIWKLYMMGLIFNDSKVKIPNFAYVKFMADKFREHSTASSDISIPSDKLFPSSETKENEGYVKPIDNAESRGVIVPLLHFPLRNAIVFEWDMKDNFSAGDAINKEVSGSTGKKDDIDKLYYPLLPVRYCDVFGRADLFSFRLFNKTDWDIDQIRRLPFAESDDYIPSEEDSTMLLPEPLSIGLDKDNREALSFNYQINLLHDEDFITYPNLFGEKNAKLKMLFLDHQVSMFEEPTIHEKNIIADNIEYVFFDSAGCKGIKITSNISQDELNKVNAIVLYDMDKNNHIIYLARNVGNLKDDQKLESWYLYPVFNE